MSTPFYPLGGAAFAVYMQSLIGFANANLVELGLNAAEIAPLQNAFADFESALGAQSEALNAARAATENRYAAQFALVDNLQNFNRVMQASPNVTDAQREGLGLPVRDKKRTPSPVPTSHPLLLIDISQRLQHKISFVDQNARGRRAKPKGVRACKIFQKIAAVAPLNLRDYEYVGDCTKPPFVNHFDNADAGKTVHYIAYWANPRDQRGPVSEVFSATING